MKVTTVPLFCFGQAARKLPMTTLGFMQYLTPTMQFLLAVLLYLVALPFFFFAGIGVIVFFVAAAYLLGREYFLLAAMRFRSIEEAKAFRKEHASTVFAAGCVVAAFVSIPIVNLATPLFGTAFMVHMHKRLSGPRPELLEPAKTPPTAA